ncbi:hypothetical protein TNCV_1743921, partial [Trichonephila clavipes]
MERSLPFFSAPLVARTYDVSTIAKKFDSTVISPLRSYDNRGTRPYKKGEGFRVTGLWRASHHQESGNYLEERPAQPPRVGGAFEKSIDGGLNLLWLTWCG